MSARALLFFCSLLALAGPASAQPGASAAKEALRQLKDRIETVQKRLAEAEESKTEAADALRQSETAISDANRALAELAERSRRLDTRLAQLRREASALEGRLKDQQAALGRLLYRRYVAGRPEPLAILLNGGDPNAIARQLHYYSYVAQARADVVYGLRVNLARLERLAEEAESQSAALTAITREQAAQRQRLEREQRGRALLLTRISREVERQRREVDTLKRDEARLARLIEQLAKAIARAPKPRERAAPRAHVAPRLRNERLPEPGRIDGPFAQLKGRLALPVRGELASRFGSPRQGGGVVWKGLFIAAPAGEEVRAIAAGRVVFADWLRGFGNLLIIDHGEGYMSLYGYNETLYRRVGDAVGSGERIAAVGNTGGHPDSGLYFELRHEGRAFDPLTWVNVR